MRFAAVFAELSVSATKTLVQVTAASNRPVRICEVSVSFKGTDNVQAPIQVQLVVQTTAGTASVLTPVKLDQVDASSIQASAQETFTVEPTSTDILKAWEVHPQTGLVYQVPEPELLRVPGGSRVGLRVVSPSVATTCVGYLECHE